MRSAGIIMNKIAAVILVGGKSSRMGSDKAHLPLHGKRLADVVADAARASGVTDIYVSGEMDGYVSLPDKLPHLGPVGGICSSIPSLAGNYQAALFIPVDMPLLGSDIVRLLAEHRGAACHFEQGPLPCALPLDAGTLGYAERVWQQLAAGSDMSVRRFLDGMGAVSLPLPPSLALCLTNTNTPQEWKAATHESAHQ